MHMNLVDAKILVDTFLRKTEQDLNAVGRLLPDYEGLSIQLTILENETLEYDFGWVFFYTTKEHSISGDFRSGIAGNAPLIIDRNSCELIETGSAKTTDYYVSNYIKTGDPFKDGSK